MSTKPTDEQIDRLFYAKCGLMPCGSMREVVRAVLALAAEPEPPDCETCKHCGTSAADSPCCTCKKAHRLRWELQPAEPETPDRKDQWFGCAEDPTWWYGPTVKSEAGCHEGNNSKHGARWLIRERQIAEGVYLRIPPKPNDKVQECREPVKGERWYNPASGELRDTLSTDHVLKLDPIFGLNRWIEPQPERAWPVGPFKVERDGGCWTVRDAQGTPYGSMIHKTDAEAVSLALTEFWNLVRAVRRIRGYALGGTLEMLDALLRRIDAGGFQTPEAK